MANVLLGATGSVAAVRVPALFDALTAAGHAVKVVATSAATYFFDPDEVRAKQPNPPAPFPGREGGERELSSPPSLPGKGAGGFGSLILDADEWPGRADGERYARGDEVMHIELRKWADIFAIAPLDA